MVSIGVKATTLSFPRVSFLQIHTRGWHFGAEESKSAAYLLKTAVRMNHPLLLKWTTGQECWPSALCNIHPVTAMTFNT